MKTLTITEGQSLRTKPPAVLLATLIPIRRDRVPKRLSMDLVRPFRVSPQTLVPLPPLATKRTYASNRTQGWISRLGGNHLTLGGPIEIELPPGTPRYVNAATLLRLLGGGKSDRLLRRTDDAWTFCDKSLTVDLLDTTTEYRVGPVAVYS